MLYKIILRKFFVFLPKKQSMHLFDYQNFNALSDKSASF